VDRAAEELDEFLSGPVTITELGSGSGRKTRRLIEAVADHRKPLYMPIDVSPAAIEWCRQGLGDVAVVEGFEDTYLPGLRRAVERRPKGHSLLVLFLGSNIGNFDRQGAEGFLSSIRSILREGDGLFIGTDLVKPVSQLLEAYDDPTGVTAAFNRNMLARLNRELGADFDLRQFEHEARYDAKFQRVEMHLRSVCDQSVSIPDAGIRCSFREGETIWTEASNKYRLDDLPAMAQRTGFRSVGSWVDEDWPFAESLWVASATNSKPVS